MINNSQEAFLWSGTGIDEIDDAIMDLIVLSELRIDAALEIAEEISAVKSKWKHMLGKDLA